MVDALLSAYTATGDAAHLRNAEQIMVFTLNHFWDKAGGFVDIATDLHDSVGLTLKEVRRRPVEDSPYAGANAVAALCLARLHALTGNDDYRLHHDELMTAFAGAASRYGPVFAGTYHLAAELRIHPPAEVVVLGPHDDPRVRKLQETASGTYSAGQTARVVAGADPPVAPPVAPIVKPKEAKTGPLAIVCQAQVCS